MSNIIAKFGLICWGFIGVFIVFLAVAGLIPTDYLGVVSTILGLAVLAIFVYDLRKIYLREGLDFGWFLTIKKGYWRMLVGLVGFGLFSIGLFVTIFPGVANELGERHGMKVAKVLAILFWMALISAFLSLGLNLFSETVAHWRLGKLKDAIINFGGGVVLLLVSIFFLWGFLDLINENFLSIPANTQNWISGIFAILSIAFGLWSGRYEDLKDYEEEKKAEKQKRQKKKTKS